MRPIDADALRERLQSLAYDDWNQGIAISFSDACHEIIDVIEEQPTIESEQRWIPMTERPPEVDVDVLVTEDTGGMEEVWIDSCWVDGDSERTLWYTSLNVTAWMPLPEPYKGGE